MHVACQRVAGLRATVQKLHATKQLQPDTTIAAGDAGYPKVSNGWNFRE